MRWLIATRLELALGNALVLRDIQRLGSLHCFDSLALNAAEELRVGGNVMDETNNLAGSPDLELSDGGQTCKRAFLTYTKVFVAVQEDLSATLATDVLGNLLEFAGWAGLFNVDGLESHLVGEETGSVLPSTEHEGGVCFLGIYDGLLDVVMDGCFDSAHEPGAHVDTTGSKGHGSGQAVTIGKAS